MNLLQTREALLCKGKDYESAKSHMIEYNNVLFEYAELLTKNDAVDSISIRSGKIIVKMCKFPVSYYLTNEIEFGIIPSGIATGSFENEYALKMVSMMSGKDTIIDIGANFGFYSCIAGKLFPRARIYAFEPIPKTHKMLLENIHLNRLNNIITENYALTEPSQASEQEQKMYYSSEAPEAASFQNIQERDTIETIDVRLATLDDYCTREGVAPQFIKCDVEGSELFVFKGAEKVLRKYQPVIFVEILRKWCAKFGHTANDVVDFLTCCGYKMYTINNTNLEPLIKITDETIDTNFVFLPK